MAGGGVSSSVDPLDVTEHPMLAIRAAVAAAENWGIDVTAQACKPRAVRLAIEAGVKCIDHVNLPDDDPARLTTDKSVCWRLQPCQGDQLSALARVRPTASSSCR